MRWGLLVQMSRCTIFLSFLNVDVFVWSGDGTYGNRIFRIRSLQKAARMMIHFWNYFSNDPLTFLKMYVFLRTSHFILNIAFILIGFVGEVHKKSSIVCMNRIKGL